MTATVIDGKASAARLRDKIADYTADLKSQHGLQPGLATVLVGKDPASEVYVRNKRKTAEALGFKSVHVELPADVAQAELVAQVKKLSADASVHGILVQLPLPKHLDEAAVLDALDPAKDVERVEALFMRRVSARWGEARAESVRSAVSRLDKAESLHELLSALAPKN